MSDTSKPLPRPITLGLADGEATFGTVGEALDALMSRWPEASRGARHRDAVDACLKVAEGHRSAADAEAAIRAAAEEAGLRISVG